MCILGGIKAICVRVVCSLREKFSRTCTRRVLHGARAIKISEKSIVSRILVMARQRHDASSLEETSKNNDSSGLSSPSVISPTFIILSKDTIILSFPGAVSSRLLEKSRLNLSVRCKTLMGCKTFAGPRHL